jgi:hypothetical protein
MTAITRTDIAMLCDLLGRTDALWSPIRKWDRPYPAVIIEQRIECLHRRGVLLHIGGNEAARKRAERQFGKLEAKGLLTVRRDRQRRISVRVDDAVEWLLRTYVGHTLPETLHYMQKLAECEANGMTLEWNGTAWTPESVLCKTPWCPREEDVDRLVALQDTFSAAFNRQWVISDSDCRGRTWYSLTIGGHNVLSHPPKLTAVQRKSNYVSLLEDEYQTGYGEQKRLMHSMTPNDSQCIGPIPLPASFWAPNPKLAAAIRAFDSPAAGNGKPTNQHP